MMISKLGGRKVDGSHDIVSIELINSLMKKQESKEDILETASQRKRWFPGDLQLSANHKQPMPARFS